MNKIITPVVTIFDNNGKVDYKGNEKVIDFLIEGGVDGILVLGSTGEFTNLTVKEKYEFFKFYSEYTKGRVELYAGTGGTDFNEIVLLSNKVYGLGFVAPVIIAPYYYGLDQEKLYIFYSSIAKELTGDLYIYNYPDRTGHSISSQTVLKLLESNKNIIGIKDSISEPTHTNSICFATEKFEFDIYSGFDDQFLYNISIGGKGCIGGLSNIVPEIWSDLVKASNNKDFDRSLKMSYLIHKLMPIYSMDSNVSLLLKKLMKHRKIDINTTAIFPFNQIDEKKYLKAEKLLDQVIEEYQKNI